MVTPLPHAFKSKYENGHLRPDLLDQVYGDLIESLRGLIEVRAGSLKRFCESNGIDRWNLYRIVKGKHDISVGLYLFILERLDVTSPLPDYQKELKGSLRDYLKTNHQAINESLLVLNY